MEIAFAILLVVWIVTTCFAVYAIRSYKRIKEKYYDSFEERIFENVLRQHEKEIAIDMSNMLDEMSIALIEQNGLTEEQQEFLAERYSYAKWEESISITEEEMEL